MVNAKFIASPNYTVGRGNYKADNIVIHWFGQGNLATTDKHFLQYDRTHPFAGVSSHFAVEDTTVHQYVSLADTAWHCHDYIENEKSVGIEHSAEPGRPASDLTYETSAQLIADLWHQLLITPGRASLHKHSDFYNTQCCGTMDLDRLSLRAMQIYNSFSGVDQSVAPAIPATEAVAHVAQPVPVKFSITVHAPLGVGRFRSTPHVEDVYDEHGVLTKTNIVVSYANGTVIECDEMLDGDLVTVKWKNGDVSSSAKWYRSSLHKYYISAAVSIHN